MGNSSSNQTNDWDSDTDDEHTYEHTYKYHTSVLRKSPADGFESDYEDDDDELRNTRGRNLRALPGRNVKTGDGSASTTASASTAVNVDGSGDRNININGAGSAVDKKSDGLEKETCQNHSALSGGGGGGGGDGGGGDGGGDAHTSNCASQHDSSPSQGTRSCDLRIRNEVPVNPPGHGPSDQSRAVAVTGDASQTSQSSRQTGQQHAARAGRSTGTQRDVKNASARGGRGSGEAEREEETYETAREGSGEEGGEVESDGVSRSTVTPPRTRPQSDSDYTVSEEATQQEESCSEEESVEEEEEIDTPESDYDTDRAASPASTRSGNQRGGVPTSRVSARSDRSPVEFSSPETSQGGRRLPSRFDMSAESYRLARKRPPSPRLPAPTSKRIRPSERISFSPNRARFGIFDSESETDNAMGGGRREGRKRRAAPPSPPPLPPQRKPSEKRSLSTRTLHQAARQAATQFVETSRKILRDARTAARILRESTSKRRSSRTLDPEEGPSKGKKQSLEKRETRNSPRVLETRQSERNRNSRLSVDSPASSSSNRRGAVKRKLENSASPPGRRKRQQRAPTESDADSEESEEVDNSPLTRSASWRQVRKDGGRLRKFTRNEDATTTAAAATSSQPTRRSPRLLSFSNCSVSLPVLPGADSNNIATLSRSSSTLNSSFPPSAAAPNPFQTVTLRPTPKSGSAVSVDSISHELRGVGPQWPTIPFSSLLTDVGKSDSPLKSFALSAGSVWARISARTSSFLAGDPEPNQASAMPGPSGVRMATRATGPEVAATSYPPHSTPRVPSLSLTGQFAQSGRFAFLLENVLQVTVISGSVATAATNAIVITTDSQLQHTNAMAHSVVLLAGPQLPWVCQNYLRRHPRGLQVCEVLDTPAGGELPALISHVLHVVVPETEMETESSTSPQAANQHRKLLLCTYLNCLKHASEKLGLSSLGFPLLGAGTHSADECIQVFFDALLVYLAERTPTCPLHAVQLLISNSAQARFAAEVLEARLQALKATSVDSSMAAVFREYFNVPDFCRNNGRNAGLQGAGGGGGGSGGTAPSTSSSPTAVSPPQASGERNPSGKPAVKRRRL